MSLLLLLLLLLFEIIYSRCDFIIAIVFRYALKAFQVFMQFAAFSVCLCTHIYKLRRPLHSIRLTSFQCAKVFLFFLSTQMFGVNVFMLMLLLLLLLLLLQFFDILCTAHTHKRTHSIVVDFCFHQNSFNFTLFWMALRALLCHSTRCYNNNVTVTINISMPNMFVHVLYSTMRTDKTPLEKPSTRLQWSTHTYSRSSVHFRR